MQKQITMQAHKGITAFIVERTFPGVETKGFKGKLGIRAGNTGEVFLKM